MSLHSEAQALLAGKRAYNAATDILDRRLDVIERQMEGLTTSWQATSRQEYLDLKAKWEREVRKLRALGIQISATIGKSLNDLGN